MKNVHEAIIQFLANEFHQEAESITEDTSFDQDLGLTSEQILELLHKLQDALNLEIPEDEVGTITTVGQLFASLQPEDDHS